MKKSLKSLILKKHKLRKATVIKSIGKQEKTLQLKQLKRKVKKEEIKLNKLNNHHSSTYLKKFKWNLMKKIMKLNNKMKMMKLNNLNYNMKCAKTYTKLSFQKVYNISWIFLYQILENVAMIKDVMKELA